MQLYKDCLVTPRNGLYPRCDGSEAPAQPLLIKRGRMACEEPGAPATKPVEKPPFAVLLLLWWSVASHRRRAALQPLPAVRPGTASLRGLGFHSQTGLSWQNDPSEPGSALVQGLFRRAPGHYPGSLVHTPSQLPSLFVTPDPPPFLLQPMYNDAFFPFLSWERELRAAWTHPRHC